MHKLTEKQAKWLIEQFNIAHTSLMKEPAEGMFHVMDCRAIINRCTEKEFPALLMNIQSSTKLLSIQSKIDPITNDKLIAFMHKLICYDKNDIFIFNYDEFKKFADGCNKIVEWLNAQ